MEFNLRELDFNLVENNWTLLIFRLETSYGMDKSYILYIWKQPERSKKMELD
jgi:hypothetical protein